MAVAVLCFGSSAFANTIVSMHFLGGTAPAYGGPVVAAYNFNINGSSTVTPLICDDYLDDIATGQTWNALVTNLQNVNSSNTYFFGTYGLAGYEEAAYLAQEMYAAGLTSPASLGQTDLNYAIWAIFDPSLVGGLDAGATTDLANAVNAVTVQHAPLSDFANVYIYTPVDASGKVLTAGPRPQEMIGVVTPEVSTSVLSGVGLLGLLSLMFLFPGKVRIA
jgi:hypothetical protein